MYVVPNILIVFWLLTMIVFMSHSLQLADVTDTLSQLLVANLHLMNFFSLPQVFTSFLSMRDAVSHSVTHSLLTYMQDKLYV